MDHQPGRGQRRERGNTAFASLSVGTTVIIQLSYSYRTTVITQLVHCGRPSTYVPSAVQKQRICISTMTSNLDKQRLLLS